MGKTSSSPKEKYLFNNKELEQRTRRYWLWVSISSLCIIPFRQTVQVIKNTSVIRQRANLKTGVSRKQSPINFPKNEHFLPHNTQTCVSGGKNVRCLGNLSGFVFLKHPFWDSPFLPYYRRTTPMFKSFICVYFVTLEDVSASKV